jgi:RNA methyltransferase, TrmH family
LPFLVHIAVKHCVKLRSHRAYRRDNHATILSGNDLLLELDACIDPRTLFFLKGQDVPVNLRHYPRIVAVSEGVMAKITGLESIASNAFAAEVNLPAPADFLAWQRGTLQRLLVLERCQDPGNLGTMLRTALACGWDGAFLLPGCADPFNDKAVRASRGACFKLPIACGSHEDWRSVTEAHALKRLAGDLEHRGRAASPSPSPSPPYASARSFDGEDLQKHGVSLVLGSEGQGLSSEALKGCSRVSIPMAEDMESLNVAAAGAILMWYFGAYPDCIVSD